MTDNFFKQNFAYIGKMQTVHKLFIYNTIVESMGLKQRQPFPVSQNNLDFPRIEWQ